MKWRYISATRNWSNKEYSWFDFPAHSVSTFNVFWGSLGTSIFGNSSSVANNTRSRLPSRLSFHFLWLWSLQAKYLYYSNFLILKLYKGQVFKFLKIHTMKKYIVFFLKRVTALPFYIFESAIRCHWGFSSSSVL